MSWVRGPTLRTGIILLMGHMAAQTQVIDCLCGWAGSARVIGVLGARRTARSSSSWTTGRHKLLN